MTELANAVASAFTPPVISPEARAVAKRWRRMLNTLMFVLPTLMFIEYLVLVFGLSVEMQRELGIEVQSGAQDFSEVAGMAALAGVCVLANYPFWLLGVFGGASLERHWPAITPTKWAIVGGAIGLLVVYAGLELWAPFQALTLPQGAGDGLGFMLALGPVIALPLVLVGWWAGRLFALVAARRN